MKIIDRVFQYIDYKGIKPIPFEKKIGLSNGYLGKQQKRNADLGEGIILKIVENCPEINPYWLLTGQGEMLNTKSEKNTIKKNDGKNDGENDEKPKVKKTPSNEEPPYNIVPLPSNRKTKDAVYPIQEIPLYDLEATAGLKELFSGGKSATQVLDTIKIPHLPKCDGAISITGDSMYPLLKSGDMVLYKEVPLDSIFYGEMYLLAYQIDGWEEYITVKYIQKSELGDDYLKLVSQNQHHQPKDVLKAHITAIAIIKASIRINTMM